MLTLKRIFDRESCLSEFNYCFYFPRTQSYISSQSLPKVPYVKALDVWMATCMAFVFAAIMEFGFVNVQRRKEQDEFVRRACAVGRDTNGRVSEKNSFGNYNSLFGCKKIFIL